MRHSTNENGEGAIRRYTVWQVVIVPTRALVRHAALALTLVAAGCVGPDATPTNRRLELTTGAVPPQQRTLDSGETAIILAFSGGGARSAAFGYGVLSALAEEPSPGGRGRRLADDVAVVAGVSGGAVLASYFALYGREGLGDFREQFLGRDVEASLRMSFSPPNILRGYRGGVNDLSGFPAWLDANLFKGATLGTVTRPGHPRLVIHATDLYNRAPFIFDRSSFTAICSNYDDYPLAYAVAASAAVPVVFAPLTLRNFRTGCEVLPEASTQEARSRQRSSLVAREYADSLRRYETASDLNYLKLYDGGLVDGVGTQSLLHLMGRAAPEPIPPERALNLRHVMVIVVDASTRIGGELSKTARSPKAPDAIVAAIDAMINIPNLQSYDALRDHLPSWRDRFVQWRCSLDSAKRGCGDLDIGIVRLALSDIADPALAHRILGLHNRLSLEAKDVDFLSGLGRSLLRAHPGYQRFLDRIRRGTTDGRISALSNWRSRNLK
ncbi:patatin-like phospholipase family protein (plasmid) [Ensifer adhaerens]|uniref:patatin-like phospholipase family protein n=1 Tax=Ensifer adhaerens TaxID=106592 RepID=UPI0023A9A3ED|nr:patatin-like phospholipase family protein [Ensifer adhaerens]WDZ80066.1 patatin-like phospholipase family protein [Ensifer adhaerens]